MPTSNVYQISKIMEKIIKINPLKVLDVGCGFGKYGVLVREYLELWDGRYDYTFKRQVDAVEVFADYITPMHRYIYNKIYQNDIFDIVDQLVGYDLILIIGTLEHFEKIQGIHLLYQLLKENKGILISTPRVWQAQEAGFGNKYEAHKCAWFEDEFIVFPNTQFIPDEMSIICYLTQADSTA